MSVDASVLARDRAAARDGGPDGGTDRRTTEEVVRTFNSRERMDVIAKQAIEIEVGSPATKIVMTPLSTRQVMALLPKLKAIVGPVITAFRSRKGTDTVPIDVLFDTITDNIEQLPQLLTLILQRGNPSISEEFVLDKIDLILDMKFMMPIFLWQNGLDKLFNMGKLQAPSSVGSNGAQPVQDEKVSAETKITESQDS